MDERTLTALQGSIAKWEAVADGSGVDHGDANCPLCQVFNDGKHCCDGCPVKQETGRGGCEDTPFDEWHEHRLEKHRGMRRAIVPGCAECARLAQAELDFLRSLLPRSAA